MNQQHQMTPEESAVNDQAVKWAMGVMAQMPKATPLEQELHITSILVVFWGALWGTFGTEYARGFIENQLRGMQGKTDVFTPPSVQ